MTEPAPETVDCPACGRPQHQIGHECPYCGVIFEKWMARRQTEEPAPPPVAPAAPRPILESTAEERRAFRVDPLVRTVFAVGVVFVEPAVFFLQRLLPRFVTSPYSSTAIVCLGIGVYAGMVAHKRGFSDILTAGGSGLIAGIVRSGMIYALYDGNIVVKAKAALPVFGIYSACVLGGGVIAWIMRKFFDVRLT